MRKSFGVIAANFMAITTTKEEQQEKNTNMQTREYKLHNLPTMEVKPFFKEKPSAFIPSKHQQHKKNKRAKRNNF